MASSSNSRLASGRPLTSQAREIIFNVVEYLRKQKKEYNLSYNIAASTSEATGVSQATVYKILKEAKKSSTSGCAKKLFSTPKGKSQARKKKIEVDSFTDSAIRRKVHEFYAVKKVSPSIKSLVQSLKEDGVIQCEREYLRQRLKKLGFQWTRCQSNRRLLIERSDIVAWRIRYLSDINKYRRECKNIVYIDETYVQASHSVSSCWQSPEEVGITTKIGKGNRLIIVHGGGEAGFVNNALLIFKSSSTSGDYHSSMNFNNFGKWLSEKLLPNLPNSSVIVMDNAKYHSVEKDKRPTSGSLKQEIIDWLVNHGVTIDFKLTKSQLLEKVNTVNSEKTFIVDEIIRAKSHIPLRLPPYHPDLNPIELVWGDIKGEIARNCSGLSLDEKKICFEKMADNFTIDKWKKCCEHTKKIEEQYWLTDHIMDEEVDKLIISVGEDSDSSTSEDSEDE